MRKLIAAFKISLDGRTEGAEGFADWAESWAEDYGLTTRIDACIVGGGMYPGYENYWSGIMAEPTKPAWITGQPPTPGELAWAAFAANTPHHVLSRHLDTKSWTNTNFLRGIEEVAALKEMPGKDIYLMGGARVAQSLIAADLIDELHLIVHPLIAGEGSRLFGDGISRRALGLQTAHALPNGTVRLTYAFADRA